MSADLLRRAATALRNAASVACPDDWYVTAAGRVLAGRPEDPVEVLDDLSSVSYDNATLAALMHPPVALALVDWLYEAARGIEARIEAEKHVGLPEGQIKTRAEDLAVAAARAILREES